MFQARGLLQDTLSATSWCLCSFGGGVIYSPKIYVLPIEIYFRDSTSQFSFSVHLDLSDTQRVELLISQEKSSQVTQPRLSSLEKNLSLSQEELHLLWRTLTYLFKSGLKTMGPVQSLPQKLQPQDMSSLETQRRCQRSLSKSAFKGLRLCSVKDI